MRVLLRWDRAGIQQQLRAYGGRHNGETDRENRASLDRLERTPKDVCFLVSILQVREQVVSFYVSFPESALNASIALLVSIPPRCDGWIGAPVFVWPRPLSFINA